MSVAISPVSGKPYGLAAGLPGLAAGSLRRLSPAIRTARLATATARAGRRDVR